MEVEGETIARSSWTSGMELNSLWVVLVLVIGVAVAFYSICRGWRGMREAQQQATEAAASGNMGIGVPLTGRRRAMQALVAPYSGLVQQLRSQEAHQSRLFFISGASVYDKNPPSYDEIMEPPPSYDETVKYASIPPPTPTFPLELPPSFSSNSTSINMNMEVSEDSAATAVTVVVPLTPTHHVVNSVPVVPQRQDSVSAGS